MRSDRFELGGLENDIGEPGYAMVKISVLIPTYNRREILARTLDRLFAQDFPSQDYEVVVTDDGSVDGTLSYLRSLKAPCVLRVVEHGSNRGQAAARNSAFRVSQGELILFIDDDELCEPGLFKAHIAAHSGDPMRVVRGASLVAPDSPATLAGDRMRAQAERQFAGRRAGEIPWHQGGGPNTFLAASLLRACGGFDENMFRMVEDPDLAFRLWKIGAHFYHEPRAVVRQFYCKSSRQVVNDAVWGGRNLVLMCRKEPSYRRYNGLAVLGHNSWWKRNARAMLTRLPFSPSPLIVPPFWIAERLRGFAPIRRFGVRLLDLRVTLAECRRALEQAGSWRLLHSEFGMRLPVLRYHNVSPLENTRGRPAADGISPDSAISPRKFDRQIRWLSRLGYTGISASDWLAWLRQAAPLPAKPVLITFDGGYADLARYAFPVLRRCGFKAVAHVVTGNIGANLGLDQTGAERYPIMTPDQIRDWAGDGIEFGAHGRTHVDLTTLNASELKEEILGSSDDLEQITGIRPPSFAYPYGRHNPAARDVVQSGFDLALTCDEGVNNLATDPYLLRTTTVQPDDWPIDLACRLAFGWSPIDRARPRMRLGIRPKAKLAGPGF